MTCSPTSKFNHEPPLHAGHVFDKNSVIISTFFFLERIIQNNDIFLKPQFLKIVQIGRHFGFALETDTLNQTTIAKYHDTNLPFCSLKTHRKYTNALSFLMLFYRVF